MLFNKSLKAFLVEFLVRFEVDLDALLLLQPWLQL